MYLSRCTHAHSLLFFCSFTNHSSLSLSFSLSLASHRARGDYYVNECEGGRVEEKVEEEEGGSDSACGEYFCSSFHYLPLSLPGSLLSPHRRNILISVTALHPSHPHLPYLIHAAKEREGGNVEEKMNRNELGREGSEA